MESLWTHPALVSVPAAVAVLGAVWMFLRRMRESQQLGHEVADKLGREHREALRIVVSGHQEVMKDFALRMERFADRQEALAEKVTDLCATLERDIALRREMRADP